MKGLNLRRASPMILTILGAIGVIGTAILAVKATPKAVELIEDADYAKRRDTEEVLKPIEAVQVAWKCYIPAASVGLATILCIFGANGLNRKQQAMIMGAYALVNEGYKEYQKKVKELYGSESDKHVRTEIVKSKKPTIEDVSEGKLLFFDELSYRYFESTMLEVVDAEYQLNRMYANEGRVMLNDFYNLLDLPKTEFGSLAGWDWEAGASAFSDNAWIDFEHDLVVMDDGLECYIIHMPFSPTVR